MGREWYKKTMLFLVLLVTIVINMHDQAAVALECINGTSSSLGACLADEFLMESETSTMLLGGNARPVNKISYNAAGKRAPICNEKVYGNCIDNPNKKSTRCTYENRCKRGRPP